MSNLSPPHISSTMTIVGQDTTVAADTDCEGDEALPVDNSSAQCG